MLRIKFATKKSSEIEKKSAAAGFVLAIFWSAIEDTTPTPRGQKKFGSNFIKHIRLGNPKIF